MDNDGDDEQLADNRPPEPIASDYVELGTLLILFITGAPLNLAAYTQVTLSKNFFIPKI